MNGEPLVVAGVVGAELVVVVVGNLALGVVLVDDDEAAHPCPPPPPNVGEVREVMSTLALIGLLLGIVVLELERARLPGEEEELLPFEVSTLRLPPPPPSGGRVEVTVVRVRSAAVAREGCARERLTRGKREVERREGERRTRAREGQMTHAVYDSTPLQEGQGYAP